MKNLKTLSFYDAEGSEVDVIGKNSVIETVTSLDSPSSSSSDLVNYNGSIYYKKHTEDGYSYEVMGGGGGVTPSEIIDLGAITWQEDSTDIKFATITTDATTYGKLFPASGNSSAIVKIKLGTHSDSMAIYLTQGLSISTMPIYSYTGLTGQDDMSCSTIVLMPADDSQYMIGVQNLGAYAKAESGLGAAIKIIETGPISSWKDGVGYEYMQTITLPASDITELMKADGSCIIKVDTSGLPPVIPTQKYRYCYLGENWGTGFPYYSYTTFSYVPSIGKMGYSIIVTPITTTSAQVSVIINRIKANDSSASATTTLTKLTIDGTTYSIPQTVSIPQTASTPEKYMHTFTLTEGTTGEIVMGTFSLLLEESSPIEDILGLEEILANVAEQYSDHAIVAFPATGYIGDLVCTGLILTDGIWKLVASDKTTQKKITDLTIMTDVVM